MTTTNDRVPTGIDLGTSSITVCTRGSDGTIHHILTSTGAPVFHSGVHVASSTSVQFGEAAESESFIDPQNYISDIKALRGSGQIFKGLQVHQIDALDMETRLFPAIIEQTREKPTDAVLTIPALATELYKVCLEMTMKAVGVRVVAMIVEPTAAAIAHIAETKSALAPGDILVITDFGAGSTDVCVLKKDAADSFTVLYAAGLAGHAGRLLVDTVARFVLENAAKQSGAVVDPGKIPPEAKHRFYKAVEQAVWALAARPSVLVPVEIGKKTYSVELRTSDFKRILDEFMKPVAALMMDVLAKAKVDPAVVRYVLVSGGPSSNGLVREVLAAHLKMVVQRVRDPLTAGCRGAVLHCDALLRAAGECTSRSLPPISVIARECTTKSISIAVLERVSSGAPRSVCAVVAKAGEVVPVDSTMHFALTRVDQSSVSVRVIQGNDGDPAEKCVVLGEVEFKGLPAEKVKSGRIRVRVEIPHLNIAKVTVTDIVSGQTKTVSLKL